MPYSIEDQKISRTVPFFLALFLCIPIYLIPESKASTFFQFSSPLGTVTPDKMIITMILIFCLYLTIFKLKIPLSPPFTMVSLYLIWMVCTSLISLYSVNFFKMNSFVFRIIMNFGVFFITYTLCYNYKVFKSLFKKTIITFGFLNSVFSLAQFYFSDPLFIGKYITITRGFYFLGERVTRVWGFQGEPLATGTVTMVSLILLLDSFFKKDGKKRTKLNKLLLFTMSLVMFIALLLTFSRGSLISFIIGLLFLLWKNEFKFFTPKRTILYLLGTPFLILLIQNTVLYSVLFELFGQLSDGDASFTHRWGVITSIDNLLTQIGYPVLLGLSFQARFGIRDYVGVLDNGYLAIFFEDGILGSFLFFGIAFLLLRKRYEPALQSALLGVLLNMATYEMTYYSTISCLYWGILGVLAADKIVNKKSFHPTNMSNNKETDSIL